MVGEPWTWDEQTHPGVAAALATPARDLDWCDRLETAPQDATVGKVLCACAALAIARAVIAAGGDTPQATDALGLLDRWIDDPTDDRFEEILLAHLRRGRAARPRTARRWLVGPPHGHKLRG